MDVQLLTVSLEERYPAAFDASLTRDAFLVDGAHTDTPRVPLEKQLPGCVAFLWGRTDQGHSVCVRVEGVCPRLYVAMEDTDTLAALRAELTNEVARTLHKRDRGLTVHERTFCHFYGYEPDSRTPSGRKEHRYAEVRYPSLASWRHAVSLRRHAELSALRARVRAVGAEHTQLASVVEALRCRVVAEGHGAASVDAWRRRTEELATLTTLHELLKTRLVARTEAWAETVGDTTDVEEEDAEVACRPVQEWFVDPMTRFLQETGLTPARWMRLQSTRAVAARVSTCDLEVQCDAADLRAVPSRDGNAPYTSVYYDIETTGLNPTVHEVIQVSLVVCTGAHKRKVLVCTREHDPITGVQIYSVSTEADLLVQTQRVLVEADADFVVAYNGVNFDNPFLMERQRRLGVTQFLHQSRFPLRACRFRELQLQSSGMGDNKLRYFDTPGRTTLDWFVKLRRDLTQEPSYALDHFAKKVCGRSKVELASGLKWRRMTPTMPRDPPFELADTDVARAIARRGAGAAMVVFTQDEWASLRASHDALCEHHWVAVSTEGGGHCCYYTPANTKHRAIADLYNGSTRDRARLGFYCVEDSDILEELDRKRAMTVEILEFAGVFAVVPEWIYFRGQQVRFVSQVLRKARVAEATPLLLNRPPDGFQGEDRQGYDGAVVVEPVKGFHKEPVGCLDWKSLYPATMISTNTCHSTCVLDPALHDADGVVRYDISDSYRTYFVRESVHRGILPQILEELATERTRAKDLIKRAAEAAADARAGGDERAYQHHSLMSKVYDGRQAAIKTAMNSIYGACGTSVDSGAKFPCLDVSATVTFMGREAMRHKRRILAERFSGLTVVYGDTDSVMICFPDAHDVASCARKCEEAARFVTDYFRRELGMRAMELEFEKVFHPYLLEGKKRYMGLKFERDKSVKSAAAEAEGEMVCKGVDAKGVETERKDTLPFLKQIMTDVRDALMYRRDEAEALRLYRGHLDRLVAGAIPMELLTLKKTLSSKVEHKTEQIAHARVNAKRREREPGSEAQVNEQVEYVILNGHKDAKTTMLAEDPSYVRDHGLALNYKWYFEHCIRDAMKKIFQHIASVDHDALTKEYAQRLNANRLGVNASALTSLLARPGTSAPAPSVAAPAPSAVAPAPSAPRRRPAVNQGALAAMLTKRPREQP
jgi:DNA polymerase elongation subunit (family B)